jgi:MFS family permease
MIGAIVSTYAGGQGVGNIFAGWSMDGIGRRNTILLAAIIGFIGGALQCASINVRMFLGARIIAGFAVGLLFGTTSVYNAEISPPKNRGLMVGLQAQARFRFPMDHCALV